jgi:toxin ParE1/3/4
MPAKIYAAVAARLLEIWDYTLSTWSEEQADVYVSDLIAAINSLPGDRYQWRPVADKSLRGVWFIRHQHHFVFFRELPSGVIGVISILHENMDLPARLKADAAQGEEK